jgi:hypothetical protein
MVLNFQWKDIGHLIGLKSRILQMLSQHLLFLPQGSVHRTVNKFSQNTNMIIGLSSFSLFQLLQVDLGCIWFGFFLFLLLYPQSASSLFHLPVVLVILSLPPWSYETKSKHLLNPKTQLNDIVSQSCFCSASSLTSLFI